MDICDYDLKDGDYIVCVKTHRSITNLSVEILVMEGEKYKVIDDDTHRFFLIGYGKTFLIDVRGSKTFAAYINLDKNDASYRFDTINDNRKKKIKTFLDE